MSTESNLAECRLMLKKILKHFSHKPSKDVRWWLLNPKSNEVDVYEVERLAFNLSKKRNGEDEPLPADEK